MVDQTKNLNKQNQKCLVKNDDNSTMIMTTISRNGSSQMVMTCVK